jgi:hypothetical protein
VGRADQESYERRLPRRGLYCRLKFDKDLINQVARYEDSCRSPDTTSSDSTMAGNDLSLSSSHAISPFV